MIDLQQSEAVVHDLGNYIQIAASAVHIIARHATIGASDGLAPIVSHAAASLERASALIRRARMPDSVLEEGVSLDDCLRQMGPLLSYALGPDVRLKLLVGLVP